MQIRNLAAGYGLRWLRDGWRLFRRQPFALVALAAFYLLLVVLLPVGVPLLGPALAGFVGPFASFGMMEACREADRGNTPTPLAFGVAVRSDPPRREMIRLGLIQAGILLLLATALAVAGLDEIVSVTPAEGSDTPNFHVNGTLMALHFLITVPIQMAMWFAPVFVGWHRIPAGKAMFFSFVACWRNRWPLLVYALAVVGLSTLGIVLLFALLEALALSTELGTLVGAPLVLIATGFILTTLYPTYRAIVVGPGESV